MSLTELTRNAFQSGLTPSKWLAMCKLYISKNMVHVHGQEIESDLSNSVLVLFRSYPGDPSLQLYLRHAIHEGILPLATFVSTFLAAARIMDLHNVSTLDMLCRLALECHYSSGMPPIGSLVHFTDPPAIIVNTVQNGMTLLRIAYSLPSGHAHRLTDSASELLILLLTTMPDVSQIPAAQVSLLFQEASQLRNSTVRLADGVRSFIEEVLVPLSIMYQDEKTSRDAQVMHTVQMALGKGDTIGANSTTDIITCSLLLHALVSRRADEFGAGDERHAVVLLIALLRWASWTPSTFYRQILQSAVTCFAQAAAVPSSRSAAIWRAFVVGRLPKLLALFEKSVDLDNTPEADWRPAMHMAVASLLHRPDLLLRCDSACHQGSGEHSQPFVSELLHQLLAAGLVEQTTVASISPSLQNDFHPRIQTEASEHGMDIEPYLESRLGSDTSVDDASSLVGKIWKDPCSHATFADVVHKRFTTYSTSNDIESLGQMCKILSTYDHALEVLSLHVKMRDLLAHALAIVEDYDCETVGDPQAAVSHFGNIVLFLQTAITKFNLTTCKFVLGDRTLTTDLLDSAAIVYRPEELKGEDASAFSTWFKTLFDTSSEGIEDSILRSTKPRSLLRIAATLLVHSIYLCHTERKLDKEVLNNGVSYFQSPLLNWTTTGVATALLREYQRRGVFTLSHVEILQSLLQAPSCPGPALRLSAPQVLRILSTTKLQRPAQFDSAPLMKLAKEALGVSPEDPGTTLPLPHSTPDPVLQAIREALEAARTGKAPGLDIQWCLLFTDPIKFLVALWTQLSLVSTMGDLEAPRRVATFVLTAPRSSRSPPLLPVFLHVVLPTIITTADHLAPADQTLAVELVVGIISSSLIAALSTEWALLSVCKEQKVVLGQSALAMARRLSGDLRKRTHSPTSSMIVQRLTSSSAFMANFPTFMAEL